MIVDKITQIVKVEPTELEITEATLLSIEEYKKYGDNISPLGDWWWLRSPGIGQNYAAIVYTYGSVGYYGLPVHSVAVCVRPALKLKNLKSSNFQIGDNFNVNDYTFTIISKDYALCDSSIGEHRFDGAINDYEKSEAKRFVDAWFKTRIK